MAISVGLNTAMRALLVQQGALDRVAHNIANVNTPGYSRQRVHLGAVPPPDQGLPGQGVEILSVERVRDLFVDFQIRAENRSAGEYEARSRVLEMAELSLGEPGEGGMRAILVGFFNSWRDLSNAPEQSAMRSAVVQAGATLATAANRADQSFSRLRDESNSRVGQIVTEVNGLAQEIADLNQKIVAVRATGDPAGDLTDQRDLALDRLSHLVDINYVEQESGRVDVLTGGRSLVGGNDVYPLEVVPDAGNGNYWRVQWAADGEAYRGRGGELKGYLDMRDVDLPARIADLDTLVSQVITDVNAAHAAGFALDGVTTGTDFFAGTGAADIEVNGALFGDLNLVAASTLPNAPGDGSNALALADLQAADNLTGGSETYEEFYGGFVTRLGVAVKDAQGLARAQSLSIEHLEQLRQSVSGVNLDEEMVNLVQYQRAFEASSRVMQKIDEMLDQLINRTI